MSIKWASRGESVPKSHVRAIQYVISFFLPNNLPMYEEVSFHYQIMKSAYCSQPLLARNFKVLKSPSRHTATVPAQEPTPRHDKCGGAACGCIVLPKWLPKSRDYLHGGGGKCLIIRHIAYGCRCFGSRDTVDAAANACRCAVRNMSVVSHSLFAFK